MSLSYMLKVVLGCTHTRPSGRGRWPFSHLTVLKWPHCSLACTHTRPSGRGRWPSQLWPGHGRLLYIRHHVVTRHHQASAAWTIIKSAASQSFNNNGQQHREHTNSWTAWRDVYRLMGKKARRLYYVRGRRIDYTSSSSGCVAVRVRVSAH